jgi:dTDP-4-amino-4,6-dideoxygalactose transaminase
MRPILPRAETVMALLHAMDERRIYANDGPLLQEYESRLAEHLGVPAERLVACSSATLGLQGAAALIPVQDFVAPAFTFPATLLALHHAGKRIRLCDINADTWQIEPEGDSDPSSTGLMRVLPFGASLDSVGSGGWTYTVIDAAASLGSDVTGLVDLPANWAVVFSLHATKVLGVGEGGAVVFGTPERASAFRSWINFGFDHSRESRVLGTNAKLPETAAAYGLAALAQWVTEKNEWRDARQLAREVDERLGIGTLVSAYPGVNPYWIVRFADKETRKRAELFLANDGIDSRRWWGSGCHTMPALAAMARGSLAVTDEVAGTTLGLPMYRGLRRSDVDRFAHVLEDILESQDRS